MVRVVGPGVCRESGRFENVLLETEARGPSTLVIDFAECPRIDSTFAGALLRLADRTSRSARVLITGARGAVADLLDTLLLGEVFGSVPLPETGSMEAVQVSGKDLTREEIMSLSLDGHERLSALNAANARRFASLLEVLKAQAPAPVAGAGPAQPGAGGTEEERGAGAGPAKT